MPRHDPVAEEIELAIAGITSVRHYNDDGDHLRYVDPDLAATNFVDAVQVIASFYKDEEVGGFAAMDHILRALIRYQHEAGL